MSPLFQQFMHQLNLKQNSLNLMSLKEFWKEFTRP